MKIEHAASFLGLILLSSALFSAAGMSPFLGVWLVCVGTIAAVLVRMFSKEPK